MRNGILKTIILSIGLIVSSCNSAPRQDWARDRILAICRAQKQYKNKNGKYGTLKELTNADLISDEFWSINFTGGNSVGYSSKILLTATGYLAAVTPLDFSTKAGMFYVDEKGVIKVHYNDDKIQPTDVDCTFSNGAKCVCQGD
jgi:hypothetical protein